MIAAGPPDVVRDVARAVESRGRHARRIELVSPLGERKGVRFAYRVETEDGVLKARHFGSADAARRHAALRARLETAFAAVLDLEGAVVFEEWLAGSEPGASEAESLSEEAGALLGRLHAQPLEPGEASIGSTAPWRAAAESDVRILESARAISASEAVVLRAELARRDQATARLALIHKDFCAENLLIDTAGRLRVVDNEQIAVEPIGFDLGRTFHRWPMTPAAQAAFRRGYRAAAPGTVDAVGFWRIVAALVGARVFLERIPARLDASIALLRRFVAGEGLEEDRP